jgi:hypothetical protein
MGMSYMSIFLATMRRKDLITSREAVKLFVDANLSEATFRRRVREKVIKPELEEGRERGALYPRDQVLAAISRSRGKKVLRQKAQGSSGATDWVQASDLPYLLALDYEMYGIENTVDISITHAWWIKNPYICRILFDKKDRHSIWGAITVMPMEEATIFNLLNGTMQEKQITADDILEYKDGGKYYAYVPSAVIKPEHRQSFTLLIGSILDFWCEQYPRCHPECCVQVEDLKEETLSGYYRHRSFIGNDLFIDFSRRKLCLSPRKRVSHRPPTLQRQTHRLWNSQNSTSSISPCGLWLRVPFVSC